MKIARVLDYPSDNTGPELYTADVFKNPLRYEDGYLLMPDGVDLGVEVDEGLLAERTMTITNTFSTNLVGLLDHTAPTST